MGWNVPATIEGKCEFSLMGLCVPIRYMGLLESNWLCLSCWRELGVHLSLNLECVR